MQFYVGLNDLSETGLSIEFNACHDKFIRSFFDPLSVFIDDGVRVCVGPWSGFNFSVSQRASKIKAFSSRRSSLTFVESCVDFEFAHLSVLMVWRLPHWRFLATLNRGSTVVIDIRVSQREAKVIVLSSKGLIKWFAPCKASTTSSSLQPFRAQGGMWSDASITGYSRYHC